MLFKNDVTHAAGAVQLKDGHDLGFWCCGRYVYFFWRKYCRKYGFTNLCRKCVQFDQSKSNSS